MNCQICRGACCEYMILGPLEVRVSSRDTRRWVELHSSTPDDLTFDCRCLKLSPGGWCEIYEDRPQLCRDFKPGSHECLDAVRRKRSGAQFNQIREQGDPLV